MSTHLSKLPKYAVLKCVIIATLTVLLAVVFQAGANPRSPGMIVPMEQVTLTQDEIASDKLIPDSEKKTRLHAPRQNAVSSSATRSGGADSINKIMNFMNTIGTRRQTPALVRSQLDNLRTLTGDDGARVNARVVFNRKNGTPRMIKIHRDDNVQATRSQVRNKLSIDAADQFLSANKDLLKIQDPKEEFTVEKKWTDTLGTHHVHYQQRYQGLPVWGREAIVHMDGANQVYMFQGSFEPTPQKTENIFQVDEQQAVNAVFDHLGMAPSGSDAVKSIAKVWYCLAGGRLVSAYAVEVKPSILRNWVYFIDAKTCAVLHRISRTFEETITSSGIDLLGNNQTFAAWRTPDTNDQVMVDPTMPLDDPPYEPLPLAQLGNTYILDAEHQEEVKGGRLIHGPEWDPTAVSIIHHVNLINAYWKDTFNRSGSDGNNKNYMVFAHVGENLANAYWSDPAVFLGDGDGQKFSSLASSLDVLAHEYGHAVVSATAKLIYENQSGALNEAFADIFACMVDREDWLMGEDCVASAPYHLRSLINPADGLDPLPAKMSEYQNLPVDQDHGGVHINCGIVARTAYLVAEGLSAENLGTSIGREKTEQIYYRALTVYLTQNSTFLDAREAAIQAAQDLYGAAEAGAVQAAWDVVEIYGNGDDPTPDPNPNPTPTDPVSGNDTMVYLRPIDRIGEEFDLYIQEIPDPFTGYDASLDKGPLNTMAPAAYRRPTAVTTDEGTYFFYVGTDNNIYGIKPDGTEAAISNDGSIHSMAVSPDGRYVAFVQEDNQDNHIYVGDLLTNEVTPYELTSPNTAPGNVGIQNAVEYADNLSFDYTSKTLAFDVYNRMTIGNDEYTYWSIGCLDLNNGQLFWPFPGQNPNYDIGNISFAYNNSFVVALDVMDYSTNPATTWVWTMDLSNQIIKKVASPNPNNYDFGDVLVCGVPSFWGDDNAITMQIFDRYNGSLAFKVPLNDWEGDVDNAVQLNDNTLVKPLMHRVGTRRLEAQMETDQEACSFSGNNATKQVVISNTGNRDLNIYSIGITGPAADSFRHDGVNGLFPRNQQKTITVYFEPAPDKQGTQSATLEIRSNADIPTLHVSLTGNTDGGDNDGGGGDDNGASGSGGGGGGCFMTTLMH